MNNPTQETAEENAVRRQQYVDRGDVCHSGFCPYPDEDERGWCVNCGYPVAEKTKESWKTFLPVGADHKRLIDKLLGR